MIKTTQWGLAGLLLAAASVPATAATVSSDFSLGDDGWRVTTFNDNGEPNFLSTFATGIVPVHASTGGDPGGFIKVQDPDEGWTYFVAPGAYRGDQRDKLGGTLSFSLQHSGGSLVGNPPHAVLMSGSRVLVADAGDPPAIIPNWTQYSIDLTAANWRVGSLTGALATDLELSLTLSDLDGLFLIGEFVTPVVETNGLDSVNLASPVPLPAAAWGLLSAVGALALRRRRG